MTIVVLALVLCLRPASADDALTVVSGSPGGTDVLETVANKAGLFKAEHLDVDKIYSGSISVCAQMVATGKGDVCAMSIESIILGYPKGLRLQTFLSRNHRYGFVLAVPADSPIRTLADFKGQPIGEPSVGSPVEIAARDMLMGAGLKSSDIVFVPVGVEGQALAALTSKKIAALADSDVALGTKTAVSGIKFRIFRDPILDSIPNNSFAARPDVIAAKSDVLGRYVRAIVKAGILIHVNPAVAARYALQGVGGNVTPEAVQSEVTQLASLRDQLIGADPEDRRIGTMPIKGVALYCKFFSDGGLTSTLVPAQDIVTNQLVPYANDFDKKAWVAEVKRMH
jgi:ABC-type nitrate/sulfonate/bicarbonate transport system substrate-binding protein